MTLLTDLRNAARGLAKTPGSGIVGVLALGLGIGACTAIFTVVDGVLLRPLPFPEPERVVALAEVSENGDLMAVPEANFLSWQESATSFGSMAMVRTGAVSVAGSIEPARVRTAFVSARFFEVLGVTPELGRTFSSEESRHGAAPVALVSHAFWSGPLGAVRDLGRIELATAGQPIAVIGVMPAAFDYPSGVDAWAPMEPLGPVNPSRSAHNWRVVARLAPGVTVAAAREELGAIARRIHEEHADVTAVDAVALPLRDQLTRSAEAPLLVLSAAVGLLLLVSCFNVAGLLLARATTRRREAAIRAALGAARWRLAWSGGAEGLLLALIGGALGVLAAIWGVDALLALAPGNLPRAAEVGVDLGVLAFALLLSLLTALAVGLAPGLRTRRVDPQRTLRENGRGRAAARGQNRLRSLLVAIQIGLAMVLLIGAALLGRSFLELSAVELGFRTEDRLVATVSSPPASDEAARRSRAESLRRIEEAIGALPGVAAVGGVNGLPMSGWGGNGRFLIEGRGDSGAFWPNYRVGSPGYFAAVGIPLKRGRLFAASDGPGALQVAVVSERVARRVWPDGDAVGARINTGNMDGDDTFMTIVGVVGDVREGGPSSPVAGTVYVHYLQRPAAAANFMFVARTEGRPETLVAAVRGAVRGVDPLLPTRFQTMEVLYRHTLSDRRFALTLVAVFGGSALALALLGLYGAVAYAVNQRVPEIGIRMALGAGSGDVVRLFVRDVAGWVVGGAAAGVLAALGFSRLLENLLFGIAPTDAASYVAGAAFILTIAFAACVASARRGLLIAPATALHEG